MNTTPAGNNSVSRNDASQQHTLMFLAAWLLSSLEGTRTSAITPGEAPGSSLYMIAQYTIHTHTHTAVLTSLYSSIF